MKSGLLLDYFVKRIFYKISIYFFYIFTIFFGDKFILEQFFSNFSNFTNLVAVKLKTLSKNSFLNFFKVTIHILIYIALVSSIFIFL